MSDKHSKPDPTRAPEWPRRPERMQPPAMRPSRSDGDSPYGYRANTQHEDSQPSDETRETRALPLVEPSRFDRGTTQPRPQPAQPAQPAPVPAPQPLTPVRPRVQQPGGTQYERQDEYDDYESGYGSGYSPNTADAYRPRPDAATPAPSKSLARSRSAPAPNYSPGYLAVDVGDERRRPFGWLLWVLVGLLAVGAIAALAFGLAWQGQYAGKVYAGVSVLGLDLGGKTSDAARKLLRDRLEGFVSQPVTLTWRGKMWEPSAEQLGLKIDVDSSVDDAYGVGRGPDYFSNAAQQWSASQTVYVVPLVVQISEPTMQAYLDGLAQSGINQQLSDGDVRLNGTEVVAMPGTEGRNLRVYDAVAAIRDSVEKLEPGTIELPVDVVKPNVTAEEVGPIQGLLAVRVSAPITATVAPGGKQFTLDRDALVRFTLIERNPDRTSPKHIQLGWKDGELKILGQRWAREATRPGQNARFAWNDGTLSVLTESADGFETDANAVIAAIKEHADTADKRQFELPGKIITPTVSSKDIGALGIKELMGTGTSTFKGSSAERATNIRVAANLLNGAVVPPGGTFSFLQTIGGIDEEHGFVEGYVIAAERTQRGVGGGVCQVSTTTFRAAFWSGVQVTERNQHSYRVGWYEANGEPVGFDAAVFDPGVDLKFVNDTQSYILIEAGVGGSTITVNFYGTRPPGAVKLEGPATSNRVPAPPDVYQVDTRLAPGTKKQVETAHAGLTTVITRRIVSPGQPDKIDKFRSVYKAWPNWYIVASPNQVPGGAPPPPTPESGPTPATEQPALEATPTASP